MDEISIPYQVIRWISETINNSIAEKKWNLNLQNNSMDIWWFLEVNLWLSIFNQTEVQWVIGTIRSSIFLIIIQACAFQQVANNTELQEQR